jgi:hypothetical protein
MPTYTNVARDGKGRDVQRERLVGHGRVLRKATDEDPNDVPRGLPQARGPGGRVQGKAKILRHSCFGSKGCDFRLESPALSAEKKQFYGKTHGDGGCGEAQRSVSAMVGR